MTTISRRALTLGLGAGALAARGTRWTAAQTEATELSGYVFANRIDEEAGEPGLTVFDLAGERTATVDVPPIDQLLPVLGSPFGIAAFTDALLVLDAARGKATEITPVPGTAFGEPLGGRGLYPSYPVYPVPSDRYALLSEGALVSFLVDLVQATALDLSAFAGEDRYFQVASLTPDGRRLVLGNSLSIVSVDLATMEVERTIVASGGLPIRSPQLAPDGIRVAYVEPTETERHVALRIAGISGDPLPEIAFEDASGTLSCRWVDEHSLLLSTFDRYGSTILTRLDLKTGATTGVGVLPGTAVNLQIVAGGTRAVASTDLDSTVWWLIDLKAGNAVRLPDLDDMILLGPQVRASRALLLGPDDYTGTGQPGERYAVLNTATGEVTTTVDRVVDQFHLIPVFSPDLRSVAIGRTGPDVNELWLLDMVSGDLVTIPDRLGAQFAPDGRHVLTRGIGRGNPLEIRDLAGDVVRELGMYDQGWWVG